MYQPYNDYLNYNNNNNNSRYQHFYWSTNNANNFNQTQQYYDNSYLNTNRSYDYVQPKKQDPYYFNSVNNGNFRNNVINSSYDATLPAYNNNHNTNPYGYNNYYLNYSYQPKSLMNLNSQPQKQFYDYAYPYLNRNLNSESTSTDTDTDTEGDDDTDETDEDDENDDLVTDDDSDEEIENIFNKSNKKNDKTSELSDTDTVEFGKLFASKTITPETSRRINRNQHCLNLLVEGDLIEYVQDEYQLDERDVKRKWAIYMGNSMIMRFDMKHKKILYESYWKIANDNFIYINRDMDKRLYTLPIYEILNKARIAFTNNKVMSKKFSSDKNFAMWCRFDINKSDIESTTLDNDHQVNSKTAKDFIIKRFLNSLDQAEENIKPKKTIQLKNTTFNIKI